MSTYPKRLVDWQLDVASFAKDLHYMSAEADRATYISLLRSHCAEISNHAAHIGSQNLETILGALEAAYKAGMTHE